MIYVLNFLTVILISGMISVSSMIDLTWLDSNGIVWCEKKRSLAESLAFTDIQILRSTKKETPILSRV